MSRGDDADEVLEGLVSTGSFGSTGSVRYLGGGWVPAGGDFVLPRSYAATIEGLEDFPGWTFALEVEVDNFGRPQCRALRIRNERGMLDATAMRRVRLRELLRISARMATERVRRDEEGNLVQARMTAADLEEFLKRHAVGRKPDKRTPLTDEHLRAVAEIYRANVAAGAPNQAIAKAMHVEAKTAARWVALARERGYLGPAIRRRAGEMPAGEDQS